MRRKTSIVIAIGALGIGIQTGCAAGAVAIDDASSLPKLLAVEVSAVAGDTAIESRSPESRVVLDAATIAASGPMIDLAEALARVPGVVAQNRWNFAQDTQLSIRGYGARSTFGVRGIKLYVNGIPATAADGQGQIGHAPLGAASAVEVIKGPLAALFGNAAGGVIKLDADPLAERRRGDVRIAASSDGVRVGATLATRDVDAEAGTLLDAARVEWAGFRPHSAATRHSATLAHARALAGDWRLDLTANALAVPRAEDPLGRTALEFARDPFGANAAAIAFDTRERARQFDAGAALSRPSVDGAPGLRAAAYAGTRRVDGFLAVPVAAQLNPLSGGGVNRIGRGYSGIELRASWPLGPATLTAGANLDRLDETRRGFENFVGATLGVAGALRRNEVNRVAVDDALLKAEVDVGQDVLVIAGARASRVRFESQDRFVTAENPDDSGRRRYAALVPAVGLSWSPGPRWSWRASIARGFETPTITELSYRPDGSAGLNFALEPARSTQREVGFRFTGASLAADAALFADSGVDEIVIARAAFGRTAFANAARSRRRGLEVSLDWQPRDALSIALAATLIDARFERDPSACAAASCSRVRLPGVPRAAASLAIDRSWGGAWSARADASARSRVGVSDAGGQSAPGFALIGFGIERRIDASGGDWRLGARIDNLADRRVAGAVIVNDANGRFFEPAPPRRIWLEAAFQF